MRMHTRIATIATTAVLLGGGVAATTTGTASAAPPEQDVTAVSCLGSALNYTSAPGGPGRNAHWPGTGKYAYTTNRCKDINLRVNQTRKVRTCFKATGKCNGWKTARKGKWALAATNVKDKSGFYIQFYGAARSTGKIAY